VAREAEAGFEGWQLARRPGGRPPLDGDNPSGTRTFRLPPDLDEALVNRAQADQVTPSEVTRQALREYLKVA
jgi:predicted HicB family RNase H-like nuclease